MLPIIGTLLAEKGLSLLGDLINKGGDKVLEVVAEKTGIDLKSAPSLTPEQALQLKQFEAGEDFKRLQLEFDEKKLYSESEKTNIQTILNAQDMYKVKNEQADKIANSIFAWNLPFIGILITVNILAVQYITDGAMLAVVTNITGMALKTAFDERQTVLNFFFGSSMGSRKAQEAMLGGTK
jgi:hypothetical protein